MHQPIARRNREAKLEADLKLTCYHCKKIGHYRSNCPDLEKTTATHATASSERPGKALQKENTVKALVVHSRKKSDEPEQEQIAAVIR